MLNEFPFHRFRAVCFLQVGVCCLALSPSQKLFLSPMKVEDWCSSKLSKARLSSTAQTGQLLSKLRFPPPPVFARQLTPHATALYLPSFTEQTDKALGHFHLSSSIKRP
ncbi:hypothetical protein BDP55DRAFT_654428 [Colletotrichum godetiae]|uniref:Secreted protein n=1 Tax=Colletotrichum godetiae TaxID=1209918 RepID=A0AAJ0AUF0_9PEZI|nr:uncharacterized protein BDP55DRAFT_654428 [Colletotrichum godetiae]KAK1689161.1 hypothetical protein BDP55DRAFT_654428 [Colletotrichum godetiae]